MMRGSIAAASTALGFAVIVSSAAPAESVMKQCDDQWQAANAEGMTNGQTWPQLLSLCRAALKNRCRSPVERLRARPGRSSPTMHTVPAPLPTQTGAAPAPAPTGGWRARVRAAGSGSLPFGYGGPAQHP